MAVAVRLANGPLTAEILGIYVRARWLVLRRGVIPAVPLLREDVEGVPAETFDEERLRTSLRLGRAVMKVLRVLPADGRCLMRSLVLTGLLARRGVYGTVVIGVSPAPAFAAHAWVEVDGQAVLPSLEPEYQRLTEI